LSCTSVERFWRKLASGELGGRALSKFEAHLRGCPECRERRRAWDASLELAVRGLSRESLLKPEEQAQLRTRTPSRPARRWISVSLGAVVVGAVALILLLLAVPWGFGDAADGGVAPPPEAGDQVALTGPDRYEVRMATSDPQVKIVWVFDRNLKLDL
jgi:anti-sigma factor RsiW